MKEFENKKLNTFEQVFRRTIRRGYCRKNGTDPVNIHLACGQREIRDLRVLSAGLKGVRHPNRHA